MYPTQQHDTKHNINSPQDTTLQQIMKYSDQIEQYGVSLVEKYKVLQGLTTSKNYQFNFRISSTSERY
jgi:hypothetical protein